MFTVAVPDVGCRLTPHHLITIAAAFLRQKLLCLTFSINSSVFCLFYPRSRGAPCPWVHVYRLCTEGTVGRCKWKLEPGLTALALNT